MRQPNPRVDVWGRGPEGAKCRTCVHLVVHERARRYYKCLKRGVTFGPGTDHRVNWPACGKYEGGDA